MRLSFSALSFISFIGLLVVFILYATAPPIVSAHNCIVPASGPWPPCATTGNHAQSTVNNSGACVIPTHGPWPACARNGGNNQATTGCVIPPSGPWPACARGNNSVIRPPTITATPAPVFARELALVVEIVDGHTIIVDMGGGLYTVRLLGITTPEIAEPCGAEAAGQLDSKIGSQWVELERDVTDEDQRTHLLRYVYIRDRMINAEMVGEGHATTRNVQPDVRYAPLLYSLQVEAQSKQQGCLWEWNSPAQ